MTGQSKPASELVGVVVQALLDTRFDGSFYQVRAHAILESLHNQGYEIVRQNAQTGGAS